MKCSDRTFQNEFHQESERRMQMLCEHKQNEMISPQIKTFFWVPRYFLVLVLFFRLYSSHTGVFVLSERSDVLARLC